MTLGVGVEDIGDTFSSLLANAPGADGAAERGLITLFDSPRVNLFEESLQRYGLKSGRNRLFSLTETLFLFAVLIHRQYETDEIGPRLRILRNLTDTAGDEIREARMNDLIASVEQLIRHGSLDGLRGFSPDRIQDEQDKRVFIEAHPEQELTLFTLEDHALLRGRVFAFELEAATLPSRAEAFRRISDKSHWPALTAALLAKGNYGYDLAGGRAVQFGTGAPTQENRWREVLNHFGRAKNSVLRESLGSLLDGVAASGEEPSVTLERISRSFSETRRSEQRLDWRYYLVTYPAMREGETGIYYGEHLLGDGGWGYSMCMLRTQSLTGGAHYRDPYLLAMYRASGLTVGIDSLWFSGYESDKRWLRLSRSGAGIRCVNNGFELDPPLDDDPAAAFLSVCLRHGATDSRNLPIPQSRFEDELIDTEDRVQHGASLLQDLIESGL